MVLLCAASTLTLSGLKQCSSHGAATQVQRNITVEDFETGSVQLSATANGTSMEVKTSQVSHTAQLPLRLERVANMFIMFSLASPNISAEKMPGTDVLFLAGTVITQVVL